jgi:hypothetical protein
MWVVVLTGLLIAIIAALMLLPETRLLQTWTTQSTAQKLCSCECDATGLSLCNDAWPNQCNVQHFEIAESCGDLNGTACLGWPHGSTVSSAAVYKSCSDWTKSDSACGDGEINTDRGEVCDPPGNDCTPPGGGIGACSDDCTSCRKFDILPL